MCVCAKHKVSHAKEEITLQRLNYSLGVLDREGERKGGAYKVLDIIWSNKDERYSNSVKLLIFVLYALF